MIASAVPTSMAPTGAHRPFDKRNITASAPAAVWVLKLPAPGIRLRGVRL